MKFKDKVGLFYVHIRKYKRTKKQSEQKCLSSTLLETIESSKHTNRIEVIK